MTQGLLDPKEMRGLRGFREFRDRLELMELTEPMARRCSVEP